MSRWELFPRLMPMFVLLQQPIKNLANSSNRVSSGKIPLLVNHFISRFNHLRSKNISCVTDEVLATLLAYDYPGKGQAPTPPCPPSHSRCQSPRFHPQHADYECCWNIDLNHDYLLFTKSN